MYRALGKRANYGFSYGAGWQRYQKSVYEDTAVAILDRQAKVEKRAFEEAWPQVLRCRSLSGLGTHGMRSRNETAGAMF